MIEKIIVIVDFFLMGFLMYLFKIDPVLVNGEWVPFFAPYIEFMKILIIGLMTLGFLVLVSVGWKEKRNSNER